MVNRNPPPKASKSPEPRRRSPQPLVGTASPRAPRHHGHRVTTGTASPRAPRHWRPAPDTGGPPLRVIARSPSPTENGVRIQTPLFAARGLRAEPHLRHPDHQRKIEFEFKLLGLPARTVRCVPWIGLGSSPRCTPPPGRLAAGAPRRSKTSHLDHQRGNGVRIQTNAVRLRAFAPNFARSAPSQLENRVRIRTRFFRESTPPRQM